MHKVDQNDCKECALGQKAAHLIACLKTNTVANGQFKEGMVIAGKRVGPGGCEKN